VACPLRDSYGKQTCETFFDQDVAKQLCGLLGVLNPEEALKYMLRRAEQEAPPSPTLDGWAAHYVEHLTGITHGTRLGYERLYGRTWQPLIGSLPLDLVTRDSVARSVNTLSAHYSDKSVASAHGLAAMMAEAVEEGLIAASPCRGIRLPAAPPMSALNTDGRVLTRTSKACWFRAVRRPCSTAGVASVQLGSARADRRLRHNRPRRRLCCVG
jgi:hypothetical protein